jgi:hypothetical protein
VACSSHVSPTRRPWHSGSGDAEPSSVAGGERNVASAQCTPNTGRSRHFPRRSQRSEELMLLSMSPTVLVAPVRPRFVPRRRVEHHQLVLRLRRIRVDSHRGADKHLRIDGTGFAGGYGESDEDADLHEGARFPAGQCSKRAGGVAVDATTAGEATFDSVRGQVPAFENLAVQGDGRGRVCRVEMVLSRHRRLAVSARGRRQAGAGRVGGAGGCGGQAW